MFFEESKKESWEQIQKFSHLWWSAFEQQVRNSCSAWKTLARDHKWRGKLWCRSLSSLQFLCDTTSFFVRCGKAMTSQNPWANHFLNKLLLLSGTWVELSRQLKRKREREWRHIFPRYLWSLERASQAQYDSRSCFWRSAYQKWQNFWISFDILLEGEVYQEDFGQSEPTKKILAFRLYFPALFEKLERKCLKWYWLQTFFFTPNL